MLFRSLESITIPASVEEIIFGAFYNCASLINLTFEENGKLVSIGSNAFENCTSLQTVEIPKSVKNIDWWVFENCTGLTSVTFEQGSKIETIGYQAFYGCTSLESIEIPNTVNSIGSLCFVYCENLTTITYNGTIAQWQTISKGFAWNSDVPTTKITCSDGQANV